MSESDHTWNADDREPTESTEVVAPVESPEPVENVTPVEQVAPAAEHSWPQYTWPPSAPTTPATAAATAGDTPITPVEPVFAPWPPTQANPTVPPDAITQSNPITDTHPLTPPLTPPGPYAANPYAAGSPYAAGPYASDPNTTGAGSAWGPPPGWTPGPAAWPPAPPAASAPAPARRGLAALAAIALVLASAGVGAGVAIAVHNNSNSGSFSSGINNLPSGNANGNGNSNGSNGSNGSNPNPFGGTNGNGTIPSGSGTLDMNAIASKVDPALVNINTTLAQGRAAGTGMLISSTGEILTNNHVIADATSIKVVIGGTGSSHTAKVVGYDVTEDVALIQITDKVSNLPTVTFGDPSKVQVGDPVVAIGNALGKGGTPSASQGQVTALDQQVTAGDAGGTQETLHGMIQVNAPIQPGDSGGALIDSNAHIIGMNTAAAGGGHFNGQTSTNIGFAIPIDNAVGIVSQIRTGTDTDKVHIGDRALLGVQVQNVDGTAPVSSGALVVGVQDGTGASDVGIQAGDVLVSLDGKPIADQDALRAALFKYHPGDSVSVGWVDASGARHDKDIKLIVGPPL